MGIIHADDSNFEEVVERSEIPAVADFYADWCMPCRMFAPIFEEISGMFEGKVKFVKVDSDAAPLASRRYEIMSIPCMVFFSEGKETGRVIGLQQKEAFIAKVKEVFGL